jgi:hypothetical protein
VPIDEDCISFCGNENVPNLIVVIYNSGFIFKTIELFVLNS